MENLKQQIIETEVAFAKMANEEGLAKAFGYYAADSAVILRGEKLIKGKAAIAESYKSYHPDSVKLEWYPDYVDVAESGDLGYTYGQYTFTKTNADGTEQVSKGIFHTVWKRQKDGRWRFVWD